MAHYYSVSLKFQHPQTKGPADLEQALNALPGKVRIVEGRGMSAMRVEMNPESAVEAARRIPFATVSDDAHLDPL